MAWEEHPFLLSDSLDECTYIQHRISSALWYFMIFLLYNILLDKIVPEETDPGV